MDEEQVVEEAVKKTGDLIQELDNESLREDAARPD